MSNTDKDNIRSKDLEEDRRYLDQRRTLDEAEFRIAESLDKALLTLSGGALAISMTFVKDIARNPVWTWALMIAWILFGLSITVLLATSYVCQLAYRKQRKILDDKQRSKFKRQSNNLEARNEPIERKNIWSTSTKVGNFSAMVIFLIGLVFLGVFICVNM